MNVKITGFVRKSGKLNPVDILPLDINNKGWLVGLLHQGGPKLRVCRQARSEWEQTIKTSFVLVLLALLFVISTATIITELLDKAQVKQRVEGWGPGFVK